MLTMVLQKNSVTNKRRYFFVDVFSFFFNNVRTKYSSFWRKAMEPRRNREVGNPRSGVLISNQTTSISSLNEAWLYTLDEYAIDTPISQIILPMMRSCFFGGAIYAVLLLQNGHGDRVRADIAGFIGEQPQS